jgi:hypothetical protein
MDNNTLKIILEIIAGLVGASLIFKFVIKKKSKKTVKKKSGSVTISDSNIIGDVAGRDIKK